VKEILGASHVARTRHAHEVTAGSLFMYFRSEHMLIM